MQVTHRASFECAYMYKEDTGKFSLNAHEYKVEVTVSGNKPSEDSILISFEELRKLLLLPDKYFLFSAIDSNRDAEAIQAAFVNLGVKVKEVFFPLCAENICNYIAYVFRNTLEATHQELHLDTVKLREDASSIVTWTNPN